MTFGDSIKTCFSKYADFNGRATRSEFWWWVLFVWRAHLRMILPRIPPVFDFLKPACGGR